MKCRKHRARYYGNWGEQGLCRACIQSLPWDLRMKILVGLNPGDRKRWQLDALIRREEETQRGRRDVFAGSMTPSEAPATSVSRGSEGGIQKLHRRSKPKKRVLSFEERRKHPRVSVKLPVGFSVRPSGRGLTAFRGRVFRSVSRDISVGGIGILVQDLALLGLPSGCQLALRISLPQSPSDISCLGELRNAVKDTRGEESGHICVQFEHLAPEHDRSLRGFMSARSSTQPS
jgi:hypothetical protein